MRLFSLSDANAMTKFFALILLSILLTPALSAQTLCNGNGNVVVYSNYDGGQLTINVDQNIPNLKIGICTYEDCSVIITGPFAGNVTAVRYAGFQGDNDHCGLGLAGTTVTGVPSNIVTVLFAPPASQSDPNGYGSIICGYSCGTGNQGGCNTATQVASYFTSVFGGTLRSYYSIYGCWPMTAFNVSNGGNCCPGTSNVPAASFIASDTSICPGDCITFSNTSTGNPTSYAWSFPGGTPSSSTSANPGTICYAADGTYTASLTATGSGGSTNAQQVIQVGPCEVPGCTYDQAVNFNPLATTDNGTCVFGDCVTNCPADLDGNGTVGVGDLLLFIAAFGTTCP
jgi:hypothetical protein